MARGAGGAAQLVADAFRRIRVDLRTCEELGESGSWSIEPPYRLWIWKEDLATARVQLGLH
jgi:hypothetical protein